MNDGVVREENKILKKTKDILIKIGGFFKNKRAIDNLCFCPPLRRTPLSPISVSQPFGKELMKSKMFALFAASKTSSSVAFGLP